MSIDLSIDSLGDPSDPRENFISAISRWYGRDLSWGDLSELQSDAKTRIMELIGRGDRQSEFLIFKLAWLGSSLEQRPLIEKQIAHLMQVSDGWEIREVGLKEFGKRISKGCKHGWDKACKTASHAWDKTCEIAEKTCDTVKEFWEEYKTEIIIGTSIVAVGVAVAAVAVYTGGVGADAAIAGGAALIKSLADHPSEEKPEPNAPVFLPEAPSLSTLTPACPTVSLGNLSPISSSQDTIEELTAFPKWPDGQVPISLQPFPQASNTSPMTEIPLAEVPQAPTLHPLTPQLDLETLYGKEYVSKLYQLYKFPDPYAPLSNQSPPPTPSAAIPQEKSWVRNAFETIGKGSIDPELFIPEPADPPAPLNEKVAKPIYNKPFAEFLEEKLREGADPNYMATMQMIEILFPKRETPSAAPVDRYTSSFSSDKPACPFYDIPLLGTSDQSTIHFHCGIKNNFSSIVEGGLCLNNTLDKEFAIQPHLVHSNNIVTGLTLVGLEKLEAGVSVIKENTSSYLSLAAPSLEVPGAVLEHSSIQKSIDYEVENLSMIAKHIIEKGNPNLKQVHVTFSNAGHVFNEALKQLPPEYQETIVVITAGTTAIIENHLACEVYNIIGDKDWPSQLCNGGLSKIEKAKNEGTNVYLIPQNETQGVIGGHYFMQQDYQHEISEVLKKEIIIEYEIY